MPRIKSNPMNYYKCREILNGREQKKLAGNTILFQSTDSMGIYTYIIRFHQTDILTFLYNNLVVVRNGGYQTATTKARINEYLGLGIYQKDFVWYYGDKEFRDGMIVVNSDCS